VGRDSLDPGADAEPLRLTVSIGVAAINPGTDDIDALLRQADQAVYAAKRAGRNCVRVYGPDTG
jgi:diguanylate cyclase (GGDEF)-like protein